MENLIIILLWIISICTMMGITTAILWALTKIIPFIIDEFKENIWIGIFYTLLLIGAICLFILHIIADYLAMKGG